MTERSCPCGQPVRHTQHAKSAPWRLVEHTDGRLCIVDPLARRVWLDQGVPTLIVQELGL